MKKFGQIKNKFFNKMLDSYKTDKKNMPKLIKIVKENKDFKDLYLLYEKIENIHFSDKEMANHFVEMLSQNIKGKNSLISATLDKLDEAIGDVTVNDTPLYNDLDVLLEDDTLNNIEDKVRAKMNLVEYVMKTKEISGLPSPDIYSKNENLLNTVLVNNFNVLFGESLNEEQREKFLSIINLSDVEIKNRITNLKEDVLKRLDNLLSESTDQEFKNKLQMVKADVLNSAPNKLSFYKLSELQSGMI